MENRELVLQTLDQLNISYQTFTHDAANTMEDCDRIDRELGVSATHCKNLFLCNRQATSFYLLLIRADKQFKTADVSKQLGISRLSFGKPEKLYEYLGTTPGAVTPLGLIFDKEHEITLLMDRDLLDAEYMVLHPCENTSSVLLKGQDFLKVFLPHLGYMPTLVTIQEHYE